LTERDCLKEKEREREGEREKRQETKKKKEREREREEKRGTPTAALKTNFREARCFEVREA